VLKKKPWNILGVNQWLVMSPKKKATGQPDPKTLSPEELMES
jgi:hypothetical protein